MMPKIEWVSLALWFMINVCYANANGEIFVRETNTSQETRKNSLLSAIPHPLPDLPFANLNEQFSKRRDFLEIPQSKELEVVQLQIRGLQSQTSVVQCTQQANLPHSTTDSKIQHSTRSLLQDDFREADALLEFKDGIKYYAQGALDGWTSSSRSQYCSWNGVTCNGQLHVNSVKLSSLQMNGSLGPSLSKLPYLEVLHLSNNSLTSEIPPELGQLSSLRVLNLENNLLFGSIPPELGNLTSLQELHLGSEGWWFNGTIPEELGLLSELEILNLGTVSNFNSEDTYHSYDPNSLRGRIPTSLANCTRLRYLDLYGNNFLTGSIPEEFGKLSNLEYLSFEQNSLTGAVPHQLGNLTKLRYLNFGNNALEGHLPVELANLTSINLLNVGTNLFTGNILDVKSTSWFTIDIFLADGNLFAGEFPEFVLSLTSLSLLYLNNNNFTGKLPAKLGGMSNLRSLVLRKNLFEGALPDTFTNFSLLTRFDVSNNRLSGSLDPLRNLSSVINLNLGSSSDSKASTWENPRARPTDLLRNSFIGSLTDELVYQWPRLVYLYLDTNSLIGSLPTALGNLTNLQHLLLHDNKFVGAIPEELGQLQNLRLLWLQDNQLTGTIPASLGHLQMVTEINLGNNSLTGVIPRELGNLTEIQYLRLHRNSLSGVIPSALGQLQKLSYLILYNNNLTGSIPGTLSNCTALENVRLSYNVLSGELTHLNFTHLPELRSFSVNGNRFSGGFPTSMVACEQLQLLDLSKNQLSGVIPSFDFLITRALNSNRSSMRVLSLASNKFSGFIPALVWKLPALQVLDLSFNAFTGSLPDDFSGLLKYRARPDPDGKETSGMISADPGKLFEQISIRRGGSVYEYEYVLEALTSFDLSVNQLGGELPSELGTLQGLLYLNLANNKFEGSIPDNLGDISNLQSLDLSLNQLSGRIPVSLSRPPLGYLNLSHNHLCGRIPDAAAFDTRYELSSFLPGNENLCGVYIEKECTLGGSSCEAGLESDTADGRSTSNALFDALFTKAFGIGTAIGFLIVLASIILIPTLRNRILVSLPESLCVKPIAYGLYRGKIHVMQTPANDCTCAIDTAVLGTTTGIGRLNMDIRRQSMPLS